MDLLDRPSEIDYNLAGLIEAGPSTMEVICSVDRNTTVPSGVGGRRPIHLHHS